MNQHTTEQLILYEQKIFENNTKIQGLTLEFRKRLEILIPFTVRV